MSLTSKLIALIVGGFVIGYLAIAFVGLEIDFRNWTEGQRVGIFIAHMPLTAMLCFIVWFNHKENEVNK